MKILIWVCSLILSTLLVVEARSAEFQVVDQPKFASISPRLVYGLAKYDFSFVGANQSQKSNSAQKFLSSIINSQFQNKKGNYIVTLDITISGKKLVSEPIMSAAWAVDKFLFVTTSEKSNIVVNRNGI